MSENEATSTRAEALTLSQAAATLGISEKTLRKRIHAGEISGEKKALEGGGVGWAVYLDGSVPEVVPELTETRAGSETERAGSQNDRAGSVPEEETTVPEPERNIAPEVTGTRAGTVPEVAPEVENPRVLAESEARVLRETLEIERENARRDREEQREQIAFLRSAVEQHQRGEAELRAALRKALEAMPKQITGAGEYSHDKADSSAGNVETGSKASAPQNAPERLPAREFARTLRRWLGIR